MRRFRWLLLLVTIAVVAMAYRWTFSSRDGAAGRANRVERASPVAPETAAVRPPVGIRSRTGLQSALFVFVTPPNAVDLDRSLPAPTKAIRYVRIDRPMIDAKSSPFWNANGALELPLPDGGALSLTIDRTETLGPDRFTATAHVVGQPQSRAVFAYNRGYLSGSVETVEGTYTLRPATETLTQYYEIDPAAVGACGGGRHPDLSAAIAASPRLPTMPMAPKRPQAEVAGANASDQSATTAAAENLVGPVVDVMMVYTQAVKTTLTGAARVAALQSEFDAAIAKTNAEFAASQVATRVRLVGMAETNYSADGPATSVISNFQNDALTALYKTNDGQMDEIHALRDQTGADVVCLVLNRSDASSIGLSFMLDTPAVVTPSAAVFNPLYAFSVVQYSTVAGTDVVPHELGHVFGCAHARGDPGALGTKDGAYTYSYGYRFFGANAQSYHDIMAYSPGSPLSYYSNPNVTAPAPISAPVGINPGHLGESDCALTIDLNAFEVSNYRLQKQQAPSGTLVNVATRAHVGTGDQVLIGGFVVNGTDPKEVLVRAAGPALAGFGVTDPIGAPMLSVYAGSTRLAQNVGWGNQADPGAIALAEAQVGAFTFPAGSADSAVLLTLAPGGYSAVVEGSGGTSGSGLVEIYDVNRIGNRIVNLSTRGYADRDQPMIGGFVVQGVAGTTKRVLVRVLGPTLARDYGVTDAMYDPEFELYDSSGRLLLKNDDWSSGTTAGSASTTNDFSPLVNTYGEQQIFATGFAPSNRREPCIMADLAPGAYSAVVKPFEDLTRTPPQPGQPGVAIVEVYEIQ